MATATEPMTIDSRRDHGRSLDHNSILIWLDQSSGEDNDAKSILLSLCDNVLTFTDPQACLDFIQTTDASRPHISILTTGAFGQMLVREHFQGFPQVKSIYIFCMDIEKHSRWATSCDKVRCVVSDFAKIIQYIQYDLQNIRDTTEPRDKAHLSTPDVPMVTVEKPKLIRRERFSDDNNLFDQLALRLILNTDEDGVDDFNQFCRQHSKKEEEEEEEDVLVDPGVPSKYFDPSKTIHEWFKPDLVFLRISAKNLADIWNLRWFLRIFYRQLIGRQQEFCEKTELFSVYHATYLSQNEFDGLKHHIGQSLIFNEPLFTTLNETKAFDLIQKPEDTTGEEYLHRVLFRIDGNTKMKDTVPYGLLDDEHVFMWFGARIRLMKIEFIDENDGHWLFVFKLYPTTEFSPRAQTLYDFYFQELNALTNRHYAFGRLLIYKGFFRRAEEWLKEDQCYEDLAELAIRQGRFLDAEKYLEKVDEQSEQGNLLRAYLLIMSSKEEISNGRRLLIKLCSETDDRLLRVRANLALGFLSLVIARDFDQATAYFTISHGILSKLFPPIHPFVAKALIGVGYCFYARQDIPSTKKHFEMAFEIQKEALTYRHPDFVRTRIGLARCLASDKHQKAQALTELEYALKILMDRYGQTNPKHIEILATNGDIEYLKKGKELRVRNVLLDYI